MVLLEKTIKKIGGLDYTLMEKAQERLNNLTKPQGSLGRLEELAKLIVGITRNGNPVLKNKVIFTMSGDHGVTEEGISAYPKEVTPQMVYNFLRGGAGINVLSRHVGARVVVVDMGVACDLKPHKDLVIKKVNYGTKNMAKGPAMSKNEAIKSIEGGIEVFEEEFSASAQGRPASGWKGTRLPDGQGSASSPEKGIDIVGTGDMGIGNTTPSSAITSVITGKPVENVTGRGTGIDDETLSNKIGVIKKAIRLNKPDAKDAIDVLSKVGGFEIGGLAGVILAAAKSRVPVVIDGFISGAAALIAYELVPEVKNYMIAAHCSVEKGHRAILDYIGLSPLLDLNLRLGEGTGSALGMSIVEASIKILTQMATFQSAAVSKKIGKQSRVPA